MAKADDDIREKFHKLTHETTSSDDSDRVPDWEPVISIGTAAKLVNLSVSALRKYEKEGLLIYERSDSGRRLLCHADIKRIKMIKHMIGDLGLNVEGIRRLLALLPCWDLKLCSKGEKDRCAAVTDAVRPCWMIKESECAIGGHDCRRCEVYRYGAYCAVTMKMLLHSTGNEG
jgi:MerR family transcriptional regulator/heat shock protein HspR